MVSEFGIRRSNCFWIIGQGFTWPPLGYIRTRSLCLYPYVSVATQQIRVFSSYTRLRRNSTNDNVYKVDNPGVHHSRRARCFHCNKFEPNEGLTLREGAPGLGETVVIRFRRRPIYLRVHVKESRSKWRNPGGG